MAERRGKFILPTSPVSAAVVTCIGSCHHLYRQLSSPVSAAVITCIGICHHLYRQLSSPVSAAVITCIGSCSCEQRGGGGGRPQHSRPSHSSDQCSQSPSQPATMWHWSFAPCHRINNKNNKYVHFITSM